MIAMQLIIAILLPWLFGILLICLFCHLLNEWLPKTIITAYGYLLGMVSVTLVMRVVPLSAYYVCAAIVILSCYPATLLWRRTTFSKLISLTDIPLIKIRFSWSLIPTIFIIGLISLHVYLITINLLLKPLFAWDAWATWSVKARTWFELKQIVDFVDRTTWLSHASNSSHVLDAWHYPDTVPLIQTWMALIINRWDDSLVNLPWLFCFLALALGFYGQLRLLGIPQIIKLIGVYLIISLPLINTHVAVAGYADLWLSTAYTFATLALIQGLINHSSAQLGLAVLAMLCVALFKTEGIVLLLTLVPIWLVMQLPSIILKKLTVISIISLIALIVIIVAFSPIQVNIPYLGKFLFAYHSVWDAVIINYFELPSWHLLGYVIVVGLLYSCLTPTLSTQQRKLILTPTVVLLGYLFVLFFLTQNYSWAQQYSSINRITLHLLPSILFCLLLIFDKSLQDRHVLSKTA